MAAQAKSSSPALVIVESPSKAKTISKILGSKYKVIASVGHVRDLPKSKLGIDIQNDFEPGYINIRGKGDVIKDMKKYAKKAAKIYLATDPDREGEAISWHIANILGIDPETPCRIEFHEITKGAIKEAVKHPRRINMPLVDAQQARRTLDRLVGYQISPILWRKVSRGLSAGRVQSAALKIICDREREILNFIPKEYWVITAAFEKDRKKFKAKLALYKGKRIEITNAQGAQWAVEELDKNPWIVSKVEEKERQRKPAPPFTTSSLQQEASAKLNFNTKKTMMVAQQLYEGISLAGHGTIGLVSYIRTDSVRLSEDARAAAKNYILKNFSDRYWSNNFFSNKKKDVQDAHEAIRPSDVNLRPDKIKESLTSDQYKLYRLIWQRFVSSQMSNAVYDSVTADIQNGDFTFRATGSKLKFDGFLAVYDGNYEDALIAKISDDNIGKMLPSLETGDELKQKNLTPEQKFTQPPSRFSEASLIKHLEEQNIGRPSTYSPIIATLLDRKYVVREKKMLQPTELGFTINNLMEQYFKDIVDSKFTSDMEDKLDEIELDKVPWKSVVRDFYGPFEKSLQIADDAIEKVDVEDEPTGEQCPECGNDLVYKQGRFGKFIACKGYPDCKYTKPIVEVIGVKCPVCGKDLVQRRSKKGRIFYGCIGFPNCVQVYWEKPVDRKCPKCGSLLTEKKGKNYGLVCSNKECEYKE